MSRKARITVISAIAVCLAVLAWLFFRSDEPVYKGKELSYWLRGYDEDLGPGVAPQNRTGITPRDATKPCVQSEPTQCLPCSKWSACVTPPGK